MQRRILHVSLHAPLSEVHRGLHDGVSGARERLHLFGALFDPVQPRFACLHRLRQIVAAMLRARLDQLEQADAGVGQLRYRCLGPVERAAAVCQFRIERADPVGELGPRLAALFGNGREHRTERRDAFAQFVAFRSHERQLFGLRCPAIGNRFVERGEPLGGEGAQVPGVHAPVPPPGGPP